MSRIPSLKCLALYQLRKISPEEYRRAVSILPEELLSNLQRLDRLKYKSVYGVYLRRDNVRRYKSGREIISADLEISPDTSTVLTPDIRRRKFKGYLTPHLREILLFVDPFKENTWIGVKLEEASVDVVESENPCICDDENRGILIEPGPFREPISFWDLSWFPIYATESFYLDEERLPCGRCLKITNVGGK